MRAPIISARFHTLTKSLRSPQQPLTPGISCPTGSLFHPTPGHHATGPAVCTESKAIRRGWSLLASNQEGSGRHMYRQSAQPCPPSQDSSYSTFTPRDGSKVGLWEPLRSTQENDIQIRDGCDGLRVTHIISPPFLESPCQPFGTLRSALPGPPSSLTTPVSFKCLGCLSKQ